MTAQKNLVVKRIKVVLFAVAIAWLCILVTDTRVLLSEVKVQPGQGYVVEEHGDLGKNQQATLVCTYFNGRKVLKTVLWYSPNNLFGRDSCPFISRE